MIRVLTPRERQVLELIAKGKPRSYIARELGIGRPTVVTYIETLRRKLGLHSEYDLATWAWITGWVNQDPSWALRRSA